MALTKVKSPVTDINIMSSGTTLLEILSAGGDIDVDVAGANVLDISSTQVTVDPAIELVAPDVTGENIDLATTSGASGNLSTTASLMQLLTTSVHPLVVGANSLQNLIMQTDGTVTLLTQGTSTTDLIDKAYVDDAIAATGGEAGFDATLATTGHLTLPTNSAGNNLIINWGVTGLINRSDAPVSVVFDEVFPNAFLTAQVSRSIASSGAEEGVNFANGSTTGMDIYPAYTANSTIHWVALGY